MNGQISMTVWDHRIGLFPSPVLTTTDKAENVKWLYVIGNLMIVNLIFFPLYWQFHNAMLENWS